MHTWKRWLGIGLIGLAGVFFAGMIGAGFLPVSLEVKGGIAFACFILMEVSFWLGTLIIGKQAVKNWWGKWRNRSASASNDDNALAPAPVTTEAGQRQKDPE